MLTSDGSGIQNPGYGFGKCSEGKLNKDFSLVFAKFLALHDFSKWSMPKALWNFEKSSNMPKIGQKIKKGFVQLVKLP